MKREIVAGATVCFIFATIGFLNRGPEGAARFALASFSTSTIFLPCLTECGVFGATVIVSGLLGAIGLLGEGISGAFYGTGFAFTVSVFLFCFLFVLGQGQTPSRDRTAANITETPNQVGVARSPSWSAMEAISDLAQEEGIKEVAEKLKRAQEPLKSVTDVKSSNTNGRLPTPSEMDAMVDSAHERGMDEALRRLETRIGTEQREKSYPTAVALVMAQTMKRVAVKYGDLGLARRAKSLDREANAALKARQPVLSRTSATDFDYVPGSSRRQKPTFLGTEGTMDPLAERYATEHRRFLEENNPSALPPPNELDSYLAAIGEQARTG